MVRTGSAILMFFIVLKDKQIFPGGNLQPYMAGCFHLYLRFCEYLTEKIDSNNNF